MPKAKLAQKLSPLSSHLRIQKYNSRPGHTISPTKTLPVSNFKNQETSHSRIQINSVVLRDKDRTESKLSQTFKKQKMPTRKHIRSQP